MITKYLLKPLFFAGSEVSYFKRFSANNCLPDANQSFIAPKGRQLSPIKANLKGVQASFSLVAKTSQSYKIADLIPVLRLAQVIKRYELCKNLNSTRLFTSGWPRVASHTGYPLRGEGVAPRSREAPSLHYV